MNAGLERSWTDSLRRARRWRTGEDPTPVYEALGWATVLTAAGELESQPDDVVHELKRRAEGAIQHARQASQDDADLQLATARARAALRVISGDLEESGPHADLLPPSETRVRRMHEGRLDGLSAGACALYLLGSG